MCCTAEEESVEMVLRGRINVFRADDSITVCMVETLRLADSKFMTPVALKAGVPCTEEAGSDPSACFLGDVESSRLTAFGDDRVHLFLISDMNASMKLRGLITAMNGKRRQAIIMKIDN